MKQIKLFPYYVGYAGFALAALTAIGLGAHAFMDIAFPAWGVSILKFLMVIGLWLPIVSKEKLEDERYQSLRLRAATYSLGFGVCVVFCDELLIDRPEHAIGASFVFALMFLLYHIAFQVSKRFS